MLLVVLGAIGEAVHSFHHFTTPLKFLLFRLDFQKLAVAKLGTGIRRTFERCSITIAWVAQIEALSALEDVGRDYFSNDVLENYGKVIFFNHYSIILTFLNYKVFPGTMLSTITR